MPEPARAGLTGRPRVYSIAAHRGFADALAAGLAARFAEPELGLARLTLLLPSRRAVRTVTEAFVRTTCGPRSGLLLPRMVVVGDLDLDETLGPLLDPLGAADVPPAADPVRRWLRLAHYLREVEGDRAGHGPAVLRRAFDLGRTMDRLLVEGIAPVEVFEKALGVIDEVAGHWRANTRTFLMVQQLWLAELAARGETDAADRRNRLFDHAAQGWREAPPQSPVVAAGVTSASPALARLLRVVSELPQGSVVLPDLDLSLDDAVWDELGTAGAPATPDATPFGKHDAVTHPQYHLKLLLHRMGVARGEVRAWHRSGMTAAPPERSHAISNLFLPPQASAAWANLPARARRLAGVRLMETAHPAMEAQAIAVLIRQALEVPERRVALVTPDRALAARVVAHLKRWDIAADDTAGQPLGQSPAGRLFLLLAQVMAEQAAPVPLIALLTHPLANGGGDRADWLDHARILDRALRGPRPGIGLEPLRALVQQRGIGGWWERVEAIVSPLFSLPADEPLDRLVALLAEAAEALAGQGAWARADGRALAAFVEELRAAAADAGTLIAPRDAHAVLRDAMERQAVRPPWGGHPRVAVYGLLEARMSRADLVICGGLVEGKWPGAPAAEPLLPPPVLRALGVPGGDFRIGLAAHDLAGALGAPEVVLSYAQRDEGAPVNPSRFVMRVRAMLGDQIDRHLETEAPRLAALLRSAPQAPAYRRPQPRPSPEQRRVAVSVTGLDRLRGDPFQFYAGSILRLGRLDPLDAEPSAAWKGDVAHLILQRWHDAGEPEGGLPAIAQTVFDEKSAHPLMRALWRPRLIAAFDTFDGLVRAGKAEGRAPVLWEAKGDMLRKGVRIHGRADRIDRLADGSLAIVDYKTGKPPSRKRVEEGFALQLGVLGLIAEAGGFADGHGDVTGFEYWSFGKSGETLGYVDYPVKVKGKRSGLDPEDFLPETARFLDDALDTWIMGDAPFTARLNPDLANYGDYDQLMRLDEWIATLGAADGAEDAA
ncbi:PD-(D/E)XK nuclease family protein [Novosphingobium colocasiae]|uniref:PD-(D/E)XK nuclease family protein n=1 Tax=Novosphingobium colocasiae TaxID=1256513 RepID=UPI0035B3DD88